MFAYEYNGYWKDVGTLGSYWEANMELIDIIPEFNLYEEFWKIYTKSDIIPPTVYIGADAIDGAAVSSARAPRFTAKFITRSSEPALRSEKARWSVIPSL